jgi:hypothetical protein
MSRTYFKHVLTHNLCICCMTFALRLAVHSLSLPRGINSVNILHITTDWRTAVYFCKHLNSVRGRGSGRGSSLLNIWCRMQFRLSVQFFKTLSLIFCTRHEYLCVTTALRELRYAQITRCVALGCVESNRVDTKRFSRASQRNADRPVRSWCMT